MERTEKNNCVVLLNTLEKVKHFVEQMSTFDCDIDVCLSGTHYPSS